MSAASNTSSTKTLLLSLDFEFVHHSETNTENACILNVICPNILLGTLFLNSLDVSEQVSHPYKIQAQLYFCIS
jgi:hypothetical protein